MKTLAKEKRILQNNRKLVVYNSETDELEVQDEVTITNGNLNLLKSLTFHGKPDIRKEGNTLVLNIIDTLIIRINGKDKVIINKDGIHSI